MTSQEIQVLYKACREAGIDASKITPSNPFSKSGGTASLLQAAVALVDPAQAARWRVDAGGGLSIATLAELESGEQLSQQAQKERRGGLGETPGDRGRRDHRLSQVTLCAEGHGGDLAAQTQPSSRVTYFSKTLLLLWFLCRGEL